MKICFPIRNASGKDYTSLEEVMNLINSEAHGTWLLGANSMWHGGIHISSQTQPLSVLTPNVQSESARVPLQFMADGTVVAWRLNNTYLNAPYCGQQLRYSSSFVLVKSECIPDKEKPKASMTFYSLYMHLAAVEDYKASPCYKVSQGHNGISMRRYTNGNYGLPDGADESKPNAAFNAPAVATNGKAKRVVNEGQRFVVSRTGRFFITRNRQTTVVEFGLARVFKDGKPSGEQYWITLDPELVERDGEYYDLMPAWMAKAMAAGNYNSVVSTDSSEQWKVTAGSPVGFMGLSEVPGSGQTLVEQEHFVHIEVLSPDSKMPGFLSNPENITNAGKLIRTSAGKKLWMHDVSTPPTYIPTEIALASGALVSKESTTPFKDAAGKWWYQVCEHGWLPEEDVQLIEQYDLLGQGFHALEETSAGDMTQSAKEKWIPQAFNQVAEVTGEEARLQAARIPDYYRNLIDKLDEDKDGKLSADEIRRGMSRRDPQVRDVLDRLVVKHHSEWYGGRSSGRWEAFYKELDNISKPYVEKWQSDMEWMSQVEAFKGDMAIWHMHPVKLLKSLSRDKIITKEMLREIWTNSELVSDSTLSSVAEELSISMEVSKIDKKNRLYHFMAQVFQEVGPSFNLNENFNYRPEVLKIKFSYYTSHPTEADNDGFVRGVQSAKPRNIANKAYADRTLNGNFSSGDGWKFRGRGMKQLTFRGNYREFTKYHEKTWQEKVDFEENPDLLLQTKYAVRSALFFWEHNKLPEIADSGTSKSVSYSITEVINKYDDHYEDRYKNLVKFLEKGVFDEIF